MFILVHLNIHLTHVLINVCDPKIFLISELNENMNMYTDRNLQWYNALHRYLQKYVSST